MSQGASSAKKRNRKVFPDSPTKSELATRRRETYEGILDDLYYGIASDCKLPEAIVEVNRDEFLDQFPALNEKWGYDIDGTNHKKFEEMTHEEYIYSQHFTDPVFRILAKIAGDTSPQRDGVFSDDTIGKFKLQEGDYDLHIIPKGIDKDVIKLWCCYLDHEMVHEQISAILQDETPEESLEVFTVKYGLVSWLFAAMGYYDRSQETLRLAIQKLDAFYEAQGTTPDPEIDDSTASLFTRR